MARSTTRTLTLAAMVAGGSALSSYAGPHVWLADTPDLQSVRIWRPAMAREASRGCDPNYSGACVPMTGRDVDCAGKGGDGPLFVQGPFRVVGSDPYRLDSDGDGIACEPFRR